MTSDASTTRHEHVVDRETAASIKRARIALVLIAILYAWAAYGNYAELKPWRDGSMFQDELTGELARMVDLAYVIGVGFQAAYQANQLRASRQLASVRLLV